MVPKRFGFLGLPLAIAIVAVLALPASASAANTYADASRPDNSGDCLTPATACQTVGGVDGALSKSAPGDTTFVADGTYAESLTLGDGKSLVSLDALDPRPIIDNGVDASPAITVGSSGAGTITGFTIRSDFKSLDVLGTVTVDDNVFDEDNVPINSQSDVNVAAGASVVVTDNVFVDPDATGQQYGLQIDSADTPAAVVSDNTFSDLAAGVLLATDTAPQITDNQFSGLRPVGTTPLGTFPGAGVLNLAGTPTVARNTFSAAAGSPVAGVYIEATAPGIATGATLSRNRISGGDVGVQVVDSNAPVTLSNDLIHDNSTGVEATDTSADSPPSTQGDFSATNATIFDNAVDIRLSYTTATLDSTIVGDPIDLVGGNGACTITYSRGPADSVSNGCDDFDSSADPQFVDPLTGDFHLQSASALIDIGNPADPGPGAVDFYGDPRMVQGKACNAVRRDIGADEFNPVSAPTCAQSTYADASRPNDLGDCVTPATACKTIAAALARSAPDQTTLVADGTYAESLVLDEGRSLVSLDSSDPKPIIDSGVAANGNAIRVEGAAGRISGFRVRSDDLPMLLQDATAEIEDNVFDEDSVPAEFTDLAVSGGSGIAIHDNVFEDPNGSGAQSGISVSENDTDTVISDNTFTDLGIGIIVAADGAQITGNQFTGARPMGPPLVGFPGAGVLTIEGNPEITENIFGTAATHPSAGVFIGQVTPFDPSGATLSRNRISGNDSGVQVVDTDLPVTLSNDLIYDNTVGVQASDSSADSPSPSTQGDFSATNATIFDNAVDVEISYTTATLNSTILGEPVDMVGGNGACSISYSRGSSAPSANGCGNFFTNADPQFVNPAAGDYHLQSTSPLIDVGDPASPGGGVVDFYGGPRAVQGKACSTARRDIGADEYEPATVPGCPPAPQPEPTPADTAPPAPKIDERPEKRSSDRSPTFKFSSQMAGVTFRCRLDHRVWKACTPPVTYRSVGFGKHRFKVQAISPTGKRSKTKVFSFRVIRPE